MELFGVAISVLTGVLTYLAWRNGRWMKQSHEDTMAVLERMEKGVVEARKEMAEARKEVAEARKEVAEARKEMAEAIKYIAQLIVSESEKTREVIKTSRGT